MALFGFATLQSHHSKEEGKNNSIEIQFFINFSNIFSLENKIPAGKYIPAGVNKLSFGG
jgi:hypothetical protein